MVTVGVAVAVGVLVAVSVPAALAVSVSVDVAIVAVVDVALGLAVGTENTPGVTTYGSEAAGMGATPARSSGGFPSASTIPSG